MPDDRLALHTLRKGQGPPVVLLHSGGMSSRQWRPLFEELSSTHTVVAPDLLGSGANPPWPEDAPFDFTMDVDAVCALVAGLGEPAHLVGHSYGGLIALAVARRMNAATLSLSLYDPVAFGVLYEPRDEEGMQDLALAARHPLFSDAEQGGTDPWFELFVDYWNGAGSWRALPAPAREGFLRVGRKVFLEVTSLLRDRTPASAYDDLDASALIMTGERSPTAARRVAERLVTAMPHARHVAVPRAGHMGPITHARAVAALVAEHVRATR